MHQGALLLHPSAMLSPPRCATHCIVVIIQHITPGREGAPAKCSKVLWGSIMSGGDLGDLPLLLLLLQLLLTPRMVAEKWPHKKAIKEHKGSEFRAQCEISRKWDICVHGARPAFDMFTRVQQQWDRIRASLLGRLQSVAQIAVQGLHRVKRVGEGKANVCGTCGGQG